MKNKNFSIILLAVVVVLAGFLVVNFKVIDKGRKDILIDQRGKKCMNSGRVWLPEYSECEWVSQEWCQAEGGNFYECESACRHDSSTEMCMEMCVPVCKFGEDNLIGGETDEGGCLIGAGYSWCESKQKCLRVWEEVCVETDLIRNYLNENLSRLSPEPEVLGGKFFVTDLEFVDESRVLVTYEDGHNMYIGEFVYELEGEEIKEISFELKEET